MRFYHPVGLRGILLRVGMVMHNVLGSLSYWRACRRRGGRVHPAGTAGSGPAHRLPEPVKRHDPADDA